MSLFAILFACVPKPVTTEVPNDPVPARTDGPVAGPHAIVEEALPPPPPPETPGGGPMHAYLVQVRKLVGEDLLKCIESGGMNISTEPALVTATIGADGSLVDVVLDRSSGAEGYDQCVLRAFRGTAMPIPPSALVGESGTLTTGQMAFR